MQTCPECGRTVHNDDYDFEFERCLECLYADTAEDWDLYDDEDYILGNDIDT